MLKKTNIYQICTIIALLLSSSFACNIQIIKNTIYYTYIVEELFLLFLGHICQI